ncbi:MAG TPA: SMP-30/gluconolactonase/LRE family protein [Thermoanaerobaculia bacterium]
MPRIRAPKLVFALSMLAAAALHAQSIFTVAGGGTDDGRAATDVGLYGTRGLAFDPAGNLYVVEHFANLVRRIDRANGTITTIAGTGGAGFGGDGGAAVRATLNGPRGIAIAADGTIYVADHENGRVRRIDAATKVITTVAGRGTQPRADGTIGDGGAATDAYLSGPWAVLAAGNNLYISEDGFDGNRIRRVDLATGKIETIAGSVTGESGASGDGGPAKSATLFGPEGSIVRDGAGNLYFSDTSNHRVRRIDANGNISTVAGGAPPDFDSPLALAFDLSGDLLITTIGFVKRVDKNRGAVTNVLTNTSLAYGMVVDGDGNIILTHDDQTVEKHIAGKTEAVVIAGGGSYVGDGLLATAAVLRSPEGIAVARDGTLFIADASNALVRRVDAVTGIISTYAGNGGFYDYESEGKQADRVAVGAPVDLALDKDGNLYIADATNGRVKKVDKQTKLVTFVAGATDATAFNQIRGIALDNAGHLFVADGGVHRVYKVDLATKERTLFAGNGTEGFGGDGGKAVDAMLDFPEDVAADSLGNVYISDSVNSAIRKVTPDGGISTIAGHVDDAGPSFGDGGPAAQASMFPAHLEIDARNDDLYIADAYSSRVRKIDAKTKIISTVIGSGTAYFVDADFTGDNGPATAAKLNFPFDLSGVAISASGDIYVSDSRSNRVRAAFACTSVAAPALTAPSAGASVSTSPALAWNRAAGAFRYDVLLDTVNPPAKVVLADTDETSFSPANLQPSTPYFWRVIAKGDPFCTPVNTASSAVGSFTTNGTCGAGAFDALAPAVTGTSIHLAWQPSAGASDYDVYLGTASPPPLLVSGVTTTSFDTTASGTMFWFVVAHAACDRTKTAATPLHTFVAVAQSCTPPSIAIASPANGASGVATNADLSWTVTGTVEALDLYFGTTNPPPLLRGGLGAATRSLSPGTLAAGATYFWRVAAKSPCAQSGEVTSTVASFTTKSDCGTPGATTLLFVPPSVSAGATYAIVWAPAAGLDAEGGYLVERATSPSFANAETQVSSTTAASFLATSPGTYYHRVRAVAGCDVTHIGLPSDVKSVTITSAPPNVIFTVPPAARITNFGEKLEDTGGAFTIENIGSEPVQVFVGRQELGGSRPFFNIVEDAAFVTLQPRTPRTFTILYSGPPNDVAGSYQGVIFVAATGKGLASTPYAFVNLKVGGGAAAKPQFLVDNAPSDYAAFGGFSGDDADRAPLTITIKNPGATPMQLGAEIGPEVWLAPETGWNTAPLDPGASRNVKLFTRRALAPSGSPLPRYTYFTVRTKDGQSARLLLQDNDRVAVAAGRTTALDVVARSFIVPEVVSRTSSRGNRVVSRLTLSNLGGDAVQAELIFTPAGRDGFDAANVKRVVVVVPPNDVVTLTDPLVQLFAATPPANGQIEVRVAPERLGLVSVRASIVVLGGGAGGFGTPVVNRGDGARAGAPHTLDLLTASAAPATITLAETSGRDGATVSLFAGAQLIASQTLARYGSARIDNVTAPSVEIRVGSGGGSVIALGTMANAAGEAGATVLSRPAGSTNGVSSIFRAYSTVAPNDTPSVTTVVPILGKSTSSGSAPSYVTSLGFIAAAAGDFKATFRDAGSSATNVVKTVSVGAGATKFYADVVKDLFGVTPVAGTVFVQAPPGGKVVATLASSSSSTPSSFLNLPSNLGEALTSAAGAAKRPLYYDGLEQSTDPTRGSRWLLVLNEVSGSTGFVNVKLYEAANRTSAIADKDLAIKAFQQVTLDTVFGALGLDATDRRKDRTNVQVVVTATAGNATLAATAVAIDNASGDTKTFQLVPTVGSGTPNISFTAPVLTQPPSTSGPPPRRRAAKP